MGPQDPGYNPGSAGGNLTARFWASVASIPETDVPSRLDALARTVGVAQLPNAVRMGIIPESSLANLGDEIVAAQDRSADARHRQTNIGLLAVGTVIAGGVASGWGATTAPSVAATPAAEAAASAPWVTPADWTLDASLAGGGEVGSGYASSAPGWGASGAGSGLSLPSWETLVKGAGTIASGVRALMGAAKPAGSATQGPASALMPDGGSRFLQLPGGAAAAAKAPASSPEEFVIAGVVVFGAFIALQLIRKKR
jgi:hypothetical protein